MGRAQLDGRQVHAPGEPAASWRRRPRPVGEARVWAPPAAPGEAAIVRHRQHEAGQRQAALLLPLLLLRPLLLRLLLLLCLLCLLWLLVRVAQLPQLDAGRAPHLCANHILLGV